MYKGFLKKKFDDMVIEAKELLGIKKYCASTRRLTVLNAYIREGERAETLLEFMDEFVKGTKEYVLTELQNGTKEPNELRMRYKVVLELQEEIQALVSIKNKKLETLEKIKGADRR